MILYKNSIAFELARDLVQTGNMAYTTLRLYPYAYESVKDSIQKMIRAEYISVIKATNVKVLHITPQGKKAVDEALARMGLDPVEKAPIVYHPPKADRMGKINEAAIAFRMAEEDDCYHTCLTIKRLMEENPHGGDRLKYSRFVGIWNRDDRSSIVYHFAKRNIDLNKNGERNAAVVARELFHKPVDSLILGDSTATMISVLDYSKMLETMPASKRRQMVRLHFFIRPSGIDDNVYFLPVSREAVQILPMMGFEGWRKITGEIHARFAKEGRTVWGLLDCRMRPPLEHLLYPNRVQGNQVRIVCFDWQESFVKEWYAPLADRFEIRVQPIRTQALADFWFGKAKGIAWDLEAYRLQD